MANSSKGKPDYKFSYSVSPDTGSSANDKITSGNSLHQLVLSGTGVPNDAITVSYVIPGTSTKVTLNTTVDASGKWAITTDSLAEGWYKFSIAETGTLKASAQSPWVLDEHTSVSIANTTSLTNQNTTLLNGTAEAGDTIRITYA